MPLDNHYYNKKRKNKLSNIEKKELILSVKNCKGFVFPGGDSWEFFDKVIYEYAISKNIPVLCICAGMQMMCKGTLYKNDSYINHHQKGKKYVHNIHLVDNTLLRKILNNSKLSVNSRHNFHIKKVKHLTVSAYSRDGYVEAVEDQNKKFFIGVQWHPESMITYDKYANKLFEYFIKSCK